MADFLTKPVADALCTMIAAGFIADHGNETKFEYAEKDGAGDYIDIKEAFKPFVKTFSYGPSRPQLDMPYIVAKTGRVFDIEVAKSLVLENWDYLRVITRAANALLSAPKGAYIGGMSTTAKLFIEGPSSLKLYSPDFRSLDTVANVEVKSFYDEFKTATNAVLTCLNPYRKELANLALRLSNSNSSSPKLEFENLIPPIEADIADGKLFKSYHGMIHTMVTHQSEIDQNAFIFEIALGKETTKVSSCFPCCTFMTANGTPPTSTHLGRGDYWNIPDGAYGRNEWETLIKNCYKRGKRLLGTPTDMHVRPPKNVTEALAVLVPNEGKEYALIPAVFLEALTFQGSFAKKITSTLPVPKNGGTSVSQPQASPIRYFQTEGLRSSTQ